MITRFLIKLLRGYKRYISPHLGHHCRFVPTCSEYAMQALATHGLVKGLLLTIWRLLRCQPFAKFGYDPGTPEREVGQPGTQADAQPLKGFSPGGEAVRKAD